MPTMLEATLGSRNGKSGIGRRLARIIPAAPREVFRLARSLPRRKKAGLVIGLWLSVFAVGVAVPSGPFRNGLIKYAFSFEPANAPTSTVTSGGDIGFLKAILYLFVVFVAFTPTNVATLCMLGAMLGAEAKARRGKTALTAAELVDAQAAPQGASYPALNGLCVFFAILAGQIVVQGELKWDDTAPNMYFRLAATATLFSVIAGTNPNFLTDLSRYFSLPGKSKNDPGQTAVGNADPSRN